MSNPSDYSKLLFATGPLSNHCCIIYYIELNEQAKISDETTQKLVSVITELKRKCSIYIISQNQMDNLISNHEKKFPIENLNNNCIESNVSL